MQTIYLVTDDYSTPVEMHLALKRMLGLPQYYGCNADALADCLSPSRPICLWVSGSDEGEVAQALDRCAAAVRDAGGTVRRCDGSR